MSVRRENASPPERLLASEDGRFSMESDNDPANLRLPLATDAECEALSAGHTQRRTETHSLCLSHAVQLCDWLSVLSCSLFHFRVHSVSTPPPILCR
jgi:hypothetical protein